MRNSHLIRITIFVQTATRKSTRSAAGWKKARLSLKSVSRYAQRCVGEATNCSLHFIYFSTCKQQCQCQSLCFFHISIIIQQRRTAVLKPCICCKCPFESCLYIFFFYLRPCPFDTAGFCSWGSKTSPVIPVRRIYCIQATHYFNVINKLSYCQIYLGANEQAVILSTS